MEVQEKRKRNNKWILPLTFGVIGVGAIVIATILATRAEKEEEQESDESGYENFDLQKGRPVVYSAKSHQA